MSVTTSGTDALAAAQSPARLRGIDDIRWLMIVLVLGMHAACTYSGFGRWYWTEPHALDLGSKLAFAFFQSFLQAFFMALLFFLAGLFVPDAYDHKGPAGFLASRTLRLGAPTLLFALVIGPLTEYYVAGSWHTKRAFGDALAYYVAHGNFLSGTGPLWFCLALLLFSVGYVAWRALAAQGRPIQPSARTLAAVLLLLVALTFLVRTVQPVGNAFYNMQLCDFASYVVMFCAGIAASRGGWLHRIRPRAAARISVACIALALATWLPLLVLGGALQGQVAPFNGGWTWQSAAMSAWEALVCIGMSLALVVGMRTWRVPGRLDRFMTTNAFAVYVIHPPLLIALALALASLAAPALLKFALLWAVSSALCFGIAAPLARRLPLVGPILR